MNFKYNVTYFDVEYPVRQKTQSLPFAVSYSSAAESTVKVAAGYYFTALNAKTFVDVTEGTGAYVYARIEQDSDQALVANGFSIVISETVKTPTELGGTSPDYVRYSNVLLAQIVDGKVQQCRYGNLLLTTWAIDGYAALWGEYIGGTDNA